MIEYTRTCPNCHGTLFPFEKELYKCDSCRGILTRYELQHTPERKKAWWDLANQDRERGDYDQAIARLEKCLEECGEDAYTYWLIVLSRYGIEYVEENGKKIPTMNRMSLTSIRSDLDYQKALQLSPEYVRLSYESDAQVIWEIQKEYINISNDIPKYDVFICYKETEITNPSKQTEDSKYAQEIYDALTANGRKVFLASITLHQEYLGYNYEAVIFSALNSARVMILVGTSLDNINSKWVKNEWSRYLKLRQNDDGEGWHKLIIVYKELNPEKLPEGLRLIEALDMQLNNWKQVLLDNVKKQLSLKRVRSPIIDMGFSMLSKGDFTTASSVFDNAINQAEIRGEAYIGLLLASEKIKSTGIDGVQKLGSFMSAYNDFNLALQHANKELKAQLINFQIKQYESRYEERKRYSGRTYDNVDAYRYAIEKWQELQLRYIENNCVTKEEIAEEINRLKEHMKQFALTSLAQMKQDIIDHCNKSKNLKDMSTICQKYVSGDDLDSQVKKCLEVLGIEANMK